MDFFLVDQNSKKTYSDLIKDINKKNHIKKYIYYTEVYDVLLDLIISMIVGKEIVILDSDFSKKEIENLGLDFDDIEQEIIDVDVKVSDFDEIINLIKNNTDNWKISLFTSGTTGRPKKVTHDFKSITRTSKVHAKFTNNKWALAYNITHFAGLQVFFQAFLNKNMMVNIFNIEKDTEQKLNEYKLTNISATPTFYRIMLPTFNSSIDSVKYVTLGGEKFDTNLVINLEKVFPNAKIRNIYASTEAGSLFRAKSDIFEIEARMQEYIKISENNELLIHKDFLGESDSYKLENEWYKTGDLVEVIGENKIKFISRNTEMINVGGYKVNPHEIEDEILKIEGIIDAIIKPRKNRITGNILIAEIVIQSDLDEKVIKKVISSSLKSKFQKWKIPQMIKFVDEIQKSRTGKKVRK